MVTIAGFTDTLKFLSVKSINTLSGGGSAQLVIEDAEAVNKATLKADLGKTITFTETRSGQSLVVFKGEFSQIKHGPGRHNLTLIIRSGARKLFRTPTNILAANHPVFSGFIKQLRDNFAVNEVDSEYVLAWASNGYSATLVQNSASRRKLYPESVSLPDTPEDIQGGEIDFLHYDNGDYTIYPATTNNEYFIRDDDHVGISERVNFDFDIYRKDGTNVTEITVKAIYSAYSDTGTFTVYPKLKVWDTVAGGGSYVTLRTQTIAEAEDATSPVVTWEDKISNYTTVVDTLNTGAKNSSDFYKESFQLSFDSGRVTNAADDIFIRVFYLHIDVGFDDRQNPGTNIGSLTATGFDTEHLAFDNVNPTYALTDFPIADGFGNGDSYIITKPLDDQLTDIFTDSGIGFTLDKNLTGADEITESGDIKHKYIGDLLSKYTSILNAIWWYEPSDDKVYLRTLDNLDSVTHTPPTDITSIITQAHIVGGEDGFIHNISIEPVRTHYRVVGATDDNTDTLVEEYTLTQGDEYEVDLDPSLWSKWSIDQQVANNKFKYKYAHEELRFAIDPVNPSGTPTFWSNLGLGKWIRAASRAPGYNYFRYDSTSEDLLVYGIGLRNNVSTKFVDHLDLILHRRKSA